MNLSNTTVSNSVVVKVNEARIDAAVALAFKESMRKMTDGAEGQVILNLEDVQFVDSSGLGAIVASMKSLGQGRKLALAGLNPTVEKVFRLTRMDSVIPLFLTLDDALAELQT